MKSLGFIRLLLKWNYISPNTVSISQRVKVRFKKLLYNVFNERTLLLIKSLCTIEVEGTWVVSRVLNVMSKKSCTLCFTISYVNSVMIS